MKKIIKNPIMMFILGAIIFSGVTGVVAYTLNAEAVQQNIVIQMNIHMDIGQEI